ncbi:helix-turn-helix domain-containing protein [Streptomyces noursei]|uniref:helix-turn-helix domain-containing protein n=1 Tax=Streptomyces noursei TaxID=1971 RepID=UPI00167977FC|nr:helix-turn-helix domain-containing protein [Streptomyces noursei]MCZ1017976.1 helix-turn-helix domain-containing protein [Streptomyces noursei]GGW85737.1 AraC family transcriptional regulator [Streptomyces noursei]
MGEPVGAAGADTGRTARGTYRERASRLPGAVLWSTTTLPGAGPVLPDGCTDLIWSAGRLLVAGPDTGPQRVDAAVPDGTRWAGLRFAPGQGPAVFGVPAHELRDRRVPLEDLWGARRARELAERAAADGPGAVLEEAARDRLRAAGRWAAGAGARGELPGRDGRTAALVNALGRGRPVAEAARLAGLGERQLHRHSLAVFGYGPKTLSRVLRLVRALDLARAGVPYAEVAARAGYADQAHLAREVKSLAGAPMGAVLGAG